MATPEFRAELRAEDGQARQPGGQQRSRPGVGDPDGDPDGATELLDEVEKAANQVFIARKFYNDVAGRTLDARRRPLARVLRLSGSARQPEFFEMDDALTDGEYRRPAAALPLRRAVAPGHWRSIGPRSPAARRGRRPWQDIPWRRALFLLPIV